MDRLTYLASPYTARRAGSDGVDRPDLDTQGYRAVTAANCAGLMLARGELVYSPIAHGHAIASAMARAPGTDWQTWARFSRRMIQACDEVAVLTIPGWRESRGVQAEIAIARDMGKPVRFVDATGREIAEPPPAIHNDGCDSRANGKASPPEVACRVCGGTGEVRGKPCGHRAGNGRCGCARDRDMVPCSGCKPAGTSERPRSAARPRSSPLVTR